MQTFKYVHNFENTLFFFLFFILKNLFFKTLSRFYLGFLFVFSVVRLFIKPFENLSWTMPKESLTNSLNLKTFKTNRRKLVQVGWVHLGFFKNLFFLPKKWVKKRKKTIFFYFSTSLLSPLFIIITFSSFLVLISEKSTKSSKRDLFFNHFSAFTVGY